MRFRIFSTIFTIEQLADLGADLAGDDTKSRGIRGCPVLCSFWSQSDVIYLRRNPRMGITASSTLRTGQRTAYKMMRGQIAASLLCLMMVGGSLDGLPDPPAKPQGNRTNLISQVCHHVPVAAKHPVSDCLACAPHLRASAFSFGRLFESSGPSYEQIFVRQAADTSPPCFS